MSSIAIHPRATTAHEPGPDARQPLLGPLDLIGADAHLEAYSAADCVSSSAVAAICSS